MEPSVIRGMRKGDPLQTKYYCQVVRSEKMNVVMELKPTEVRNEQRLPLRYVLVIDVSGSMGSKIGNQQMALLERVKLFAELAVRKVGEKDYLSIVTFSDDSVVELGMTKMSKTEKETARTILRGLQTRGNTNLESGLLKALQVISSTPRMSGPCRDCIILFTDGQANRGEMDAKKLIENYRKIQGDMNRSSCVPVSAFTIGGYKPHLLIEIARQLGSESFYWLNDAEDFETDMLIPLFLREATNISDIDISVKATENCYFNSVDEKATHLKAIKNSEVTIMAERKRVKVSLSTELIYFIHSLPEDNAKNISFDLSLPSLSFQKLNGLKVIEVTVHYLDARLCQRSMHDSILLSMTPLAVADPRDLNGLQHSDILKAWVELAAFIVWKNRSTNSWPASQEVVVKLAEQQCKFVSVSSITNAKRHAGETTLAEGINCLQNALQAIDEIKSKSQSLLPNGGDSFRQVEKITNEWKGWIKRAILIMRTNDPRNFSKLTSMETSINAESLTSGEVFGENQPFMNKRIKEKLTKEKENLDKIRKLYKEGKVSVDTVKQRVCRAIEAGDLDLMESGLQDLKAIELFGEEEVGKDFFNYVKKEIDHRKILNQLEEKLKLSLSEKDFTQTESLVEEMRKLKAKTGLTFAQKDETVLQTAIDELKLQESKRAWRDRISSFMPILRLPIVPRNLDKLSNAIQNLVRLKNETKSYDDVFTHEDNASLKAAIANLQEAKKEMGRITRKMNEMKPMLSLPRRPSHYETIKKAIAGMQGAREAARKYEGLFTKEDEVILQAAWDNCKLLEEYKARLREKIMQLKPTLKLPGIPINLAALSKAVEEMTSLRKEAKDFKDVFLSEDETLLDQASSNVALLMAKRDELAGKIAANVLEARLPKLPENLVRLQAAVTALQQAREESKDFENVFTAEHENLLQIADASVKNLEDEKFTLEKEKAECVRQLQMQMLPENYSQICQGIDTIKRIAPKLKSFEIYREEYDSMLKTAESNRNILRDKKNQIMNDIQKLKPDLKVDLIPENLAPLHVAIEKMESLKEASRGFKVFTKENKMELFEAKSNLDHLTANVDKMNEARRKLKHAFEKKSYSLLKKAIKKANRAPFIHPDELKEPRKLMLFLNPKKRRAAVREAIEEGDIDSIEKALLDLREAHVVDEKLEEKARHAMKVLQKQKKREEKERRRLKRARARRKREMKRLVKNLTSAIQSNEIENLEQALQEFEDSQFEKGEVPLVTEAEELLWHLKIERMRHRLQEAVKRRDVNELYSVLMEAKFGNYEKHMQKEYDEAKALLDYLQEMMRLRDTIMKMNRSSFTEIHGYRCPPKSVKKVMQATYTILGEKPSELKDWTKIQALMVSLDRNSITRRVQRFQTRNLQPEMAEKAERFLNRLNLAEVEEVSKVAAIFYAWAKYIVKEVKHLREVTEIAEAEEYDDEDFDSEQEDSENESEISKDRDSDSSSVSSGDDNESQM